MTRALSFGCTYPALAALRCRECQSHIYSIPEAVRQEYDSDGDGTMLPIVRETPPPCRDCPKGGPENDEDLRLSERNYAAWLLYEKIHATAGTYVLPEHLSRCELFAENMLLVKRALESGRAQAQANAYEQAKNQGGDA